MDLVKSVLKRFNLRQSHLALFLDVGKTSIGDWLDGSRPKISAKNLKKLEYLNSLPKNCDLAQALATYEFIRIVEGFKKTNQKGKKWD